MNRAASVVPRIPSAPAAMELGGGLGNLLDGGKEADSESAVAYTRSGPSVRIF